jgi:hypothetical protein
VEIKTINSQSNKDNSSAIVVIPPQKVVMLQAPYEITGPKIV